MLFFLPLLVFVAEAKPDFTVTAEELTKAYKADPKATEAKFSGKIVEVSGPFHIRRPTDVVLFGHAAGLLPKLVGCTPDKDALTKHQRLYGLAHGQTIVFRGKMGFLAGYALMSDCALVSVGPNPAALVTLAKLRAMFAKPADAKKNKGKAIVAKVRIVSIDKSEKDRVVFTVADASSKGAKAATTTVWVDTWRDDDRTAELHKVKAGEVWHALGVADNLGGTPRIWEAVLVKDLPEGVKAK